MGTWSYGITGNDTARDLLSEYQAAFFYNDVGTALQKIDAYARSAFDESDGGEWCDYFYSLADYMWRKGILTGGVLGEALRLIDSGFGLELYEESGAKALEGRKRALREFRARLVSEQPPRKKITVDLHTKPIFEAGDVVAFRLMTADKHDTGKSGVGEAQFRAMDGKYVAVRKVADYVSYASAVEPAVRDIYPVFQLYAGIFDAQPELKDVVGLKYAHTEQDSDGLFFCEGSMYYFKKRRYAVLGNHPAGIGKLKPHANSGIFFSINRPWYNADELLIKAVVHV